MTNDKTWRERCVILPMRELYNLVNLRRNLRIHALSTPGGQSDYVVQYNFYDATQAQIPGEVVKIPYKI